MKPLFLALVLAGCGHAARAPEARAADFLWSRQDDDGGWRSERYALLRSGQALTPFVLHALLAHAEAAPPGGIERAIGFLRRNARADGALGYGDRHLLEYPNYATAYALLCLVEYADPADADLIARMRAYLVGQQYREENGHAPDAPAHGGWGFGGRRPHGEAGHMDLAHTRRVLQALAASGGVPPDVLVRARRFLVRTQCEDGSFYLSPVVLDANKGVGRNGYATATCDGLLAQLAAGLPADRARDWLARHPGLERPPGIPAGGAPDWGPQLRYYHLAVRAEAGFPEGIAELLAPLQHDDGRFENAHHLMKEDDPLVCTALALIACQNGRAGTR